MHELDSKYKSVFSTIKFPNVSNFTISEQIHEYTNDTSYLLSIFVFYKSHEYTLNFLQIKILLVEKMKVEKEKK